MTCENLSNLDSEILNWRTTFHCTLVDCVKTEAEIDILNSKSIFSTQDILECSDVLNDVLLIIRGCKSYNAEYFSTMDASQQIFNIKYKVANKVICLDLAMYCLVAIADICHETMIQIVAQAKHFFVNKHTDFWDPIWMQSNSEIKIDYRTVPRFVIEDCRTASGAFDNHTMIRLHYKLMRSRLKSIPRKMVLSKYDMHYYNVKYYLRPQCKERKNDIVEWHRALAYHLNVVESGVQKLSRRMSRKKFNDINNRWLWQFRNNYIT